MRGKDWNGIIAGLLAGGGAVANSYINKTYDDETEKIYKESVESLGGLINKYKEQKDMYAQYPKKTVTESSVTPTEETPVTPTSSEELPFDINNYTGITAKPVQLDKQGKPTSNPMTSVTKGINLVKPSKTQLYTDFFKSRNELARRREQGKLAADNLTQYLSMMLQDDNPASNYDIINRKDGIYRYNKLTGELEALKLTPVEKKKNLDTDFKFDTAYKEGDNYFGLKRVYDKTSGKVEDVVFPIRADEYQDWYDKVNKLGKYAPKKSGKSNRSGKPKATIEDNTIIKGLSDLHKLNITFDSWQGDPDVVQKYNGIKDLLIDYFGGDYDLLNEYAEKMYETSDQKSVLDEIYNSPEFLDFETASNEYETIDDLFNDPDMMGWEATAIFEKNKDKFKTEKGKEYFKKKYLDNIFEDSDIGTEEPEYEDSDDDDDEE